MKVAILSESPADEAAISILVSGALGHEIELIPVRARPGGWSSVMKVLPKVLSELHYRFDADALVVVLDSDDSPPHRREHDEADADDHCRLCQLRQVVEQTLARLPALPHRNTLKVGLGLAVPAIEAWYQAGVDPGVTEAAWMRKLQGQRVGYDRKSLKRAVYGAERFSIELETQHAVAAAQRLAADLHLLEQTFPLGFGSLLRDVRAW